MRLEYIVLAALALDLVLGDPRWLPHPVRGIGWLAAAVEPRARRWIPWPRVAGVLAWLFVVGTAAGLAWAIWRVAGAAHPALADAAAVWIVYTTLAARDLARHSGTVYTALAAGDLPAARAKVALIVGRDTAGLDTAGVSRAAVETVAESTLDGVTAPLFFAFLLGPVGAMAYRAANTLDSMFGHRDERYLRFGWASARLDDLANLVPARLTALVMVPAAALLGLRAGAAGRIAWRDARKHPSPNSGFPEAATAGALGVRLGGTNTYGGEAETRPFIGDPAVALEPRHIRLANRLMFATALLFAAAGSVIRQLTTDN
jgi:adenosylcobinamide-phosphate synthase